MRIADLVSQSRTEMSTTRSPTLPRRDPWASAKALMDPRAGCASPSYTKATTASQARGIPERRSGREKGGGTKPYGRTGSCSPLLSSDCWPPYVWPPSTQRSRARPRGEACPPRARAEEGGREEMVAAAAVETRRRRRRRRTTREKSARSARPSSPSCTR